MGQGSAAWCRFRGCFTSVVVHRLGITSHTCSQPFQAQATPLEQLFASRHLSQLTYKTITTNIHHAPSNLIQLDAVPQPELYPEKLWCVITPEDKPSLSTMEHSTETNGSPTIESKAHIPIAQLTPLLVAPASRSIKAIVTLTWPYSSATGSVAFLLSEPDFRLRRTRGQVRVQFAGSSARHVAKSGIASGDEVIVCLDGVEWIEDAGTSVSTPGRGVEFELRFTERLLLQVCSSRPFLTMGHFLTFLFSSKCKSLKIFN